MNNYQLRFYFKLFIFTVLFFLGCGFQTSFWPNLISSIPGPQIWLIMILFITIRWGSFLFIFYIYFLAFCLTSFSDIPLKMLWTTLLFTFTTLWLLKNRVQLTGLLSFLLFTLLGSFIFETSYYFISQVIETSATSFMFIDRALQVLINFVFSYPIFIILEKLDKILLDQDDWQKSPQQHNETHS